MVKVHNKHLQKSGDVPKKGQNSKIVKQVGKIIIAKKPEKHYT